MDTHQADTRGTGSDPPIVLPIAWWRAGAEWLDALAGAIVDMAQTALRSAAVWERFPDSWALLNASEAELGAAIEADPWPGPQGWAEAQREHLKDLLSDLKLMYRDAALGLQADPSFADHAKDVAQYLTPIFPALVPLLVGGENGIKTRVVLLDAEISLCLLGRVVDLVQEALRHLEGASSDTLFWCPDCGRIGPASARSEHVCGGADRLEEEDAPESGHEGGQGED